MARALVALLLTAFESPAQPATSDFSFDDFLLAPLRVHLLSASNAPDWHTALGTQDVQRIVGKINQVWSQAGVHFYLESVVREEALNQARFEEWRRRTNLHWLLEIRPATSRATGMFHLYYVREIPPNGIFFPEAMFVKDQAKLRVVPNGIDEPLPRVSSHELGHALGLDHRQDSTNLMASRTTGFALNTDEIRRARAAARVIAWIQSAATVLQQAEGLAQAGDEARAREWYRRLAALPVESERLQRARRRQLRE